MRDCSFVSVGPCHQLKFTHSKGLKVVQEECKMLLELRAKIPRHQIQTICCHHEQELDQMFSKLAKRCADPFNEHKKPRKKALLFVTLALYLKAEFLREKVVPGQKLCPSCHVRITQFYANDKLEEDDAVSVADGPRNDGAECS